ncbi:hypothetical protein NIES2109_19140 [Nostoc sp. HK-01]|nr:hypothetical protein NIES2109_19140 [Nostoc sp. HK-01]
MKDAYQSLKALIKKKFESDPLGKGLVDAKPEEIKQVEGLLKDKLTQAGVDKDEEIIKAAEEVMKKEDPQGFEEGKYNTNVTVQGDVFGVAGTNLGTVNIGPVTKGK